MLMKEIHAHNLSQLGLRLFQRPRKIILDSEISIKILSIHNIMKKFQKIDCSRICACVSFGLLRFLF